MPALIGRGEACQFVKKFLSLKILLKSKMASAGGDNASKSEQGAALCKCDWQPFGRAKRAKFLLSLWDRSPPQAQQELRLPENYLSYAAQPRELLTVAVWSRASLNDEGSNLQNLLFWFGTFIKTLGTTGKHNRCANLGELLEKRKDL